MKTQSKYLIVFIPLYLILFLSCSVQNASIVGKWDWKESDLSHGGCCSFVDTTTMNIMLHKAYMEFTEDGKYRLIDSLGMPVNDALYAKDKRLLAIYRQSDTLYFRVTIKKNGRMEIYSNSTDTFFRFEKIDK